MNNTLLGADAAHTLLSQSKCVYMGGICGVSMAGLARMLLALGYRVRGCDRQHLGDTADALRRDGIPVDNQEKPHLSGVDLLICTTALSETSTPLMVAGRRGIPYMTRSDLLAALMHPYPQRLAVAGMHGKSTLVGMVGAILEGAGLAPTISGGAPLCVGQPPYRLGGKEIFICEACEYKNAFLSLSPTLSLVTNIDLDHPDFFPDLEAVKASFSAFLKKSQKVIVCGECKPLCSIAPPHALRYGWGEECFIRGERCRRGIRIWEKGALQGEIALGVEGEHNALNALGAIAMARVLKIPYSVILPALQGFRGVGRRMERIGSFSGATLWLDYAHHPAEITAAIKTRREGGRRVVCLFQPHTYTRTQALFSEFVRALRLSDVIYVTDIYPAREAPIPGITAQALAAACGGTYVPLEGAADCLRHSLLSGDCCLILGAGDVDSILPHLLTP